MARCHLLRDTGSEAPQHSLRTYMGTASTAEGDGVDRILQHMKVPRTTHNTHTTCTHHTNQECDVELSSITADGDVALQGVVERRYGHTVMINRDPNHYAKGLVTNALNLAKTYPKMTEIVPSLKAHFLIGALPLGLLCGGAFQIAEYLHCKQGSRSTRRKRKSSAHICVASSPTSPTNPTSTAFMMGARRRRSVLILFKTRTCWKLSAPSSIAMLLIANDTFTGTAQSSLNHSIVLPASASTRSGIGQ